MGVNILHLSDLHIGKCNFEQQMEIIDKLCEVIKRYNEKIDAVIFTGDIFDMACDRLNEKEIMLGQAVDFFNTLLYKINSTQVPPKIDKKEILFVPGNHDICLSDEDKWEMYDTFLKRFYVELPCFYDNNLHMVIKQDDKNKILYLGFNSNKIYKDGKLGAYIEEDQFKKVDKLLVESMERYHDYRVLAFTHHPFYLFKEISSGEDGIISNGEELKRKLAGWDTSVVLHGHKHSARSGIHRLKGDIIKVVAAPTICIGDSEASFNIVKIENREVIRVCGVSANNHGIFQMKELEDATTEGLLCERLEVSGDYPIIEMGKFGENCNRIIEMMNELYIMYKSLNLLTIHFNKDVLLLCIKYKVAKRNNPALCEEMKNKLHSIYESDSPKSVIDKIDSILNTDIENIIVEKKCRDELQCNEKAKIYVSYAIVAAFFTDLYFKLKELEEKGNGLQIIENGIYYDYTYKYMFILLKCTNMDAYTDAVKKVKSYSVRFHILEEYFCCVKLNIKNIVPNIEMAGDGSATCYDFNAYVPRLIPLLTGTNIYSSDLAFVRELVQNAIDAISFRERRDNSDYRHEIYIEMGEREGKNYFSIRDYGIGMGLEVIKLYFTTLGRSYYKEHEFGINKNIHYNSISNFGVGFLSVFRLCNRIDVKTKHFIEQECYKLEMSDGQDYMIVKREDDNEFETGTLIRCEFKEDAEIKTDVIDAIPEYIAKIMQDIKYDIEINHYGEPKTIKSRNVRREECAYKIFIPIDEDHNSVGTAKRDPEVVIEDRNTDRHGMLIRMLEKGKAEKQGRSVSILNAGILMQNTSIKDVWHEVEADCGKDLRYNEITINFPPNWLKVDVSREKAAGFFETTDEAEYQLRKRSGFAIYQSYHSLDECIRKVDVSAGAYLELDKFIADLAGIRSRKKIQLLIRFKQNRIFFSVRISGNIEENREKLVRMYSYEDVWKQAPAHQSLVSSFHENLTAEMFEGMIDHFYDSSDILGKLGITGWKTVQKEYLPIVLAACLQPEESQKYSEMDRKIERLIEHTIMTECSLKNIYAEDARQELFSVGYVGEERVDVKVKTSELKVRVSIIAEEYGADRGIDAHEFIKDKIIFRDYSKYFQKDNNRDKIKEIVKVKYDNLKRDIKNVYEMEDEGDLIDVYMIAACYMGGLLEVPQEILEGETDELSRYKWILDCGMGIVYMWKLSEYKEYKECEDPTDKRYDILHQQEKLAWPNEEMRKRHLKLLELKNIRMEKWYILCFTELLSWLAEYNEEQISKKMKEIAYV